MGTNENGLDALFLGLMAETWIKAMHQAIVKSESEVSVSVSRMGSPSLSLRF